MLLLDLEIEREREREMRLVLSAIVRLFFVFIAFCFSYLKLPPPPPRYLFSSVENTSLSFSVERGGILLFSVFFPPENLMIARGRKFITAPRLSRKPPLLFSRTHSSREAVFLWRSASQGVQLFYRSYVQRPSLFK